MIKKGLVAGCIALGVQLDISWIAHEARLDIRSVNQFLSHVWEIYRHTMAR
jgi:hypothetical protein